VIRVWEFCPVRFELTFELQPEDRVALRCTKGDQTLIHRLTEQLEQEFFVVLLNRP